MARGRTYRRRKADGSWSRWYAVIDGPKTADGRRRQLTRAFDTQREAHAWLASGAAGEAGGDLRPSLADWLQEWLGIQPFTKPSTLATYRCHIDRHISPQLGQVPLEGLTRAHVQEFVRSLDERGMAAGTVHRVTATLRSALGAAARDGRIASNPVHGVRLPSLPTRLHTVWTVEQARTFLATCSDDAVGVLFRLAIVTGMRRGELLGLTWACVDLEAGELVVRASRVVVGGEIVTGTPKSRAGVRRIYLDRDTCAQVDSWRRKQARFPVPGDGLVFTHPTGAPFQPWWVSRVFDRRVAELALPRIRFHDLRHTSAAIGLAAGESLKEVSARLGHSDIAITANIYGAVLPQTARGSSERRAVMLGALPGARAEVAS